MNKRKIIIDCDPGIDDSLAIMLALTSPEIEVLGITIVCGNSPVEMGFENAKKILKQMNRLDVPVYMGEPRPLKRDYVNALDTHGADGLGESFLPEVPGYQQEISAVDFLSKALIKEKVSVIALGPMTNLARLIQKAPAAFDQIEELVSMGGSFKSHGNCSPVAEYNYWCDPDAAALVYDTLHQNGKMIHMIGLDVTMQALLTKKETQQLRDTGTKAGAFLADMTDYYIDISEQEDPAFQGGCNLHDPLAAAVAIDPTLVTTYPINLMVETEGPSIGRTIGDPARLLSQPKNTKVALSVDAERFVGRLMERLLKLARESE